MMNLDASEAPVRDTNRFTWWAQPSKAGFLQCWCVQQLHRAAGTELCGLVPSATVITGPLSFSNKHRKLSFS